MWLTDTFRHICLVLTDAVFPLRNTASLVRDITPLTFGKYLFPHISAEGHIGLLPYRYSVVRAVILEAKFHGNPKAYNLLGAVLKDYLDSMQEDMLILDPGARVLVPVPLSKNRYRSRGYNQVEEVLKCTTLSYDSHVVIRIKDTKPQTSLSKKARKDNLTDAFITQGRFEKNSTYIVVDDVTTTGATLNAVATVLRSHNVSVITVALAY